MEIIKRLLRLLAFPVGIALMLICVPLGSIYWIFTGSDNLVAFPFHFIYYSFEGEW